MIGVDWIRLKDCLCGLVWVILILLCRHIALLCFASHPISNVHLHVPPLPSHGLSHVYLPTPASIGIYPFSIRIYTIRLIISDIIFLSDTTTPPNSSHETPSNK